jgi:hypothetical protein
LKAAIQIVDCATKELVGAELFDEVTIDRFLETQREWRPVVVETANRLVKSGAPRETILRHFHWDWSTKTARDAAQFRTGDYRGFLMG